MSCAVNKMRKREMQRPRESALGAPNLARCKCHLTTQANMVVPSWQQRGVTSPGVGSGSRSRGSPRAACCEGQAVASWKLRVCTAASACEPGLTSGEQLREFCSVAKFGDRSGGSELTVFQNNVNCKWRPNYILLVNSFTGSM